MKSEDSKNVFRVGGVWYSRKTFITASRKLHGNGYNYSKLILEKAASSVTITCIQHGDFTVTPTNHLGKRVKGCKFCAYERMSRHQTRTPDWYINELKTCKINVTPLEPYLNDLKKIKHRCECGNVWNVSPNGILNSKFKRCPKCVTALGGTGRPVSYDEVIARIKAVHGTKYQLVGNYLGMLRKHRIRCNECHTSWKVVIASVIHKGSGCPNCAKITRNRNNSYKFKEVEIQGTTFKVQGYEPQAIEWLLLNNPKLKATDIKVDSSGEVPAVRYKMGKRMHTYFPDIFIPRRNHIIEVKSDYTLGIKTGKNWRKNQAKAKAVLAAGYKFSMLVMTGNGKRLFKLPEDWHSMTRLKVLTFIAMSRSDTNYPEVPKDKPTRITAKRLAEICVDAILAIPLKQRKGRDFVAREVAKAIETYV
jgi:hypothetical protein